MRSDRSSAIQYLTYGAKILKIGPADPEILRLRAKKSGMTQNWLPWNVPSGIGTDQENSRKYLPFGKKIMKIGPVDPEIALLMYKKKKLTQAKYIARSAT